MAAFQALPIASKNRLLTETVRTRIACCPESRLKRSRYTHPQFSERSLNYFQLSMVLSKRLKVMHQCIM